VSLDLEKEQVVQALCAHYAQEHLSTGELEVRFERVYKSTSRSQLDTVLQGLPSLPRTTLAPAPMYHVATRSTEQSSGALPPGEKRYLAFFSEVKKEGAWSPVPMIAAKVVFGGIVLDLREADLPPEGIVIDADVLFGELKVLLPPGVGAEVDCSAVMGEANDKAHRALPGAPTIRVRGGVIFGSISVVTKLPKQARLESWRQQLRGFLGSGSDEMGR
jgi:hypothetical protein